VRYWWVSHNQTFRHEFTGGFLWSPKTTANGTHNYFYDAMTEAQPGDIVFSFASSQVQAIGVVMRRADTTPKPDFNGVGSNWSDVGWYLEVEFQQLENPFRPKDYIDFIRPLLASKYAPLRPNGDGNQGVYLTEISRNLADLLIALSHASLPDLVRELEDPRGDEDDEILQFEIASQQAHGDPEKLQVVKARRGQGLFKANVRRYERECRVTHVSAIKHLRASHIKPWAASTSEEKLDGANGLLLAPHVDHLFDRGYISFSNDGDVLVSKTMNHRVLERWSIDLPMNVGEFQVTQKIFLEYHQDVVFQG